MSITLPFYTTSVHPLEYDHEKDFDGAVVAANNSKAYMILLDIGKVHGLYEAYIELQEKCLELQSEIKLLRSSGT